MSDLRAKVQAAIDEHLAESGGGFVTGWYVIADMIDADGEQSWAYATASDQLLMTSMGLLRWAANVADYEQRRYLESTEGGD